MIHTPCSSRRNYMRRYQTNWVRARRRAWLEANGPCQLCGSIERLEMDHVDPAQKVSHVIWSWAKERREAELKKCQVLCYTCHKKKTAAYLSRKMKGNRLGVHKLSETQVMEIYRLAHLGNMTVRQIARQFGVQHSIIVNIKTGKRWSTVTQAKPLTNPEQLNLFAEAA